MGEHAGRQWEQCWKVTLSRLAQRSAWVLVYHIVGCFEQQGQTTTSSCVLINNFPKYLEAKERVLCNKLFLTFRKRKC